MRSLESTLPAPQTLWDIGMPVAGAVPRRVPTGVVSPVDPELIHPELWRGHQLGRARHSVVPSGQPLLDHQLPGGGWPKQALTELLIRQPGVGEMRLLAPALMAVARGEHGPARSLMLFDPPATPCAWGLQQLGLDPAALIVVPGSDDALWALEQTLRSGHAGAVLAWLPQRLPPDALRRLQLAAQAHSGPAFLFRGLPARHKPSPAPLRLALYPDGPDGLMVELLKRRGPPLSQALLLELLAPAALSRLWEPTPALEPEYSTAMADESVSLSPAAAMQSAIEPSADASPGA